MTACEPGKNIYVQADAPSSGSIDADIYINDAIEVCREDLMGQKEICHAIHINMRFDEDKLQCVALNTHDGKKWGIEDEKREGLPISSGQKKFILCVTFQKDNFELSFNGWHYATYKYRTKFELTPTTNCTMLFSESMITHVKRIKCV